MNVLKRFSVKFFSFIWKCLPERMMRFMTGVMSGRKPSPGWHSMRRLSRHNVTLFHDSPIVTSSIHCSITRAWHLQSLSLMTDFSSSWVLSSPEWLSLKCGKRNLLTFFHGVPTVVSFVLWHGQSSVTDLIFSGKSFPHFEIDQNKVRLPSDFCKSTENKFSAWKYDKSNL